MSSEQERADVWHELSYLWTDNEAQIDDLARISDKLAGTSFSIEELELIYAREVAPATARYVAGIPFTGGMAFPDYYSRDEISDRVCAHQSRSWARRRLNPFRRAIDHLSAAFARRDWERIKYRIRTRRDGRRRLTRARI